MLTWEISIMVFQDLKNLRKQLYSAADRFESSYNKTDHNQIVIQLSKDYIAKALVSTVDHLGSMADKLNKSLNERASEFCSADAQFAFIEQFQGARKKPLGQPLLRNFEYQTVVSFTKIVPNKEAEKIGRRSISPFRLIPRNRPASDTKRSLSPNLISRPRWPSEPRRAVSECRRQQETKNRDKKEMETYTTSASKQLFKALINVHRSGKDISHERI
ncbi:ABL interactor-like protein 4, partial [Striga asiatica]